MQGQEASKQHRQTVNTITGPLEWGLGLPLIRLAWSVNRNRVRNSPALSSMMELFKFSFVQRQREKKT